MARPERRILNGAARGGNETCRRRWRMETERSLVSPVRHRSDPTVPPEPARRPGRRVLIVAWRDVASPQAGGSELLIDQLAAGLGARGGPGTPLCGGPAAPPA